MAAGWSRRGFLGVLGVALLWRPDVARAAAKASDPEAVIKSVGDRALAALNAKDVGQDERVRRLEELLGDATDLDLVGRVALGRDWRPGPRAPQAEGPR